MFDYSARPELLKDRVILVTGAGRGIGAAAAKSYAAHGATVLLLGKTEANLTQVYDEIEAAGHPRRPPTTGRDSVQPGNRPAPPVRRAGGDDRKRIRPSRRSAAQRLDHRPAHATGTALGRKLHAGHAGQRHAMFMLTSTLLPLLKLSQDASVIFTSSSVGRKGRAYWGAYGVSKFATEGLMQTLADELDNVAPVRANSINPGATRTSMRAQAYPGENPLNNPTPEEIMPVYLYLMGPDSTGINGQAFNAQ